MRGAPLTHGEAGARVRFQFNLQVRGVNRKMELFARHTYSARDVAWLFLRELLAATKAATGERIRDVVIMTPVEAFESYRAEVVAIGQSLGIRRFNGLRRKK